MRAKRATVDFRTTEFRHRLPYSPGTLSTTCTLTSLTALHGLGVATASQRYPEIITMLFQLDRARMGRFHLSSYYPLPAPLPTSWLAAPHPCSDLFPGSSKCRFGTPWCSSWVAVAVLAATPNLQPPTIPPPP